MLQQRHRPPARVAVDTVRTWRNRYAEHGLDGLKDRPRSGRPPRFTPLSRPESRLWRVNFQPRPQCRCRGGVAANWSSR
ncbi:helix-turn-helix domain-containing protein [Nocardia fluminea]|uniref:helix-turn-helix domain-containing protein n=1 Tax=Nocardia fluminea TaxID=134984 RepID=UPI0036553000